MSVIPPGPVDHVGIAVRDLDAACARYRELLGAEVEHHERLPGRGVEIAYLRLPGDTRIELIAPLDDQGTVARFLDKRGEGLHHICIRVEDVGAALERLGAAGVRCVDDEPLPGAEGALVAFLHPEALGGVLLELKQK